ncbi:MAG: metalloregulator ArsR/SmtB family transcription factor [Acholeplasmatales bacterium]|nr:metalloregulator ArsR/SmtB family transcription factor [Acholeplasmatales bacterium]
MEDLDLIKSGTEIADMSDFFKLLGDATRIKICLLIHNEKLCVNDIAEKLGMTKSAISHQLALLRQARLVSYDKVGKEVYYKLADDHIKIVIEMAYEHVTE